ncbi:MULTISPECIES: ABC transporter substrate-binding protein [unclassified Duganella]|uniref:substrate-binding periplasmic protein n=1 Tax=unclassified Duganella TaxID=2636909 RepID=UPI0013144A45|nr:MULTISPECIES: transporter substrate-binding domain-containing protein [unclassified Duganella]
MTINASRPLAAALLACLLASAGPAQAGPLIRLGSDDWCPYVCALDGKPPSGYLVELATMAMAAEGYRVEPVLMPLNRAITQTVHGDIEGVYAPPIDRRLRLSAPVAQSRACFYTRAGDDWSFHSMSSLKTQVVGVIDDYGYDDGPMDAYIAENRHQPGLIALAFGASAGTTNVQKLLGGRYRVILEHSAVMAQLGKRLDVASRIRQAGCLDNELPLTIGFATQDIRADTWVRALADGVRKLEASGELKALQKRYKLD